MEFDSNIFLSLFPFIFIFCLLFIRCAPLGTAVIVDRKTHYCKTKPRGGFYIFNPLTDQITTVISTSPTTKVYSGIFETYDTFFKSFSFSVTYHAESVEEVLHHLKADKRSIDDIIMSAASSTISSFAAKDFMTNFSEISDEVTRRVTLSVYTFGLIIDKCSVINFETVETSIGEAKKFKSHVCRDDGPITYNR